MSRPLEPLLFDIERKIAEAQSLQAQSNEDDLSDLPETVLIRSLTGLRAAVLRIAGKSSVYVQQVEEIRQSSEWIGTQVKMIQGVAQSLLEDARADLLMSLQELIHADIFASFLEMADHLLEAGYKDAAAVIAGSSLEEHLRLLSTKNAINIMDTNGRPKKADLINSELAAAKIYEKLDQKNVTAWLDLRNKAAHGHYTDYQPAQVTLLISSVRDFMTRSPA